MIYNHDEFMTLSKADVTGGASGKKETMSYEDFIVAPSVANKRKEPPPVLTRSHSSFIAGMAQIKKSIVQSPAAIYSMLAIPQNSLERATGWRVGVKPPEWMIKNPITDYFDRSIEGHSYKSKRYKGEFRNE